MNYTEKTYKDMGECILGDKECKCNKGVIFTGGKLACDNFVVEADKKREI